MKDAMEDLHRLEEMEARLEGVAGTLDALALSAAEGTLTLGTSSAAMFDFLSGELERDAHALSAYISAAMKQRAAENQGADGTPE